MRNSEKLLKVLSDLLENGMLNSKDIKDEIKTDLKFKRDQLISFEFTSTIISSPSSIRARGPPIAASGPT